tara:strand:+ start:95 stop:1402 length:1308 start_codon:yes stop_codon:yes gene_type:complete
MPEVTLQNKINNRTLIVGIIGLGYVGLPLFLWHAESGISVIGFDTDEVKIKNLNANRSYIKRYGSQDIGFAMQKGARATGNFDLINECDVIIICVPTPLNQYREPDLSYVTSTLQSIGPHLRQHQLVSLESTTWPGTTEEIMVPLIEKFGFDVGKNISVIYSPEREDPGNLSFSTSTIPKIVGGVTETCLQIGLAFYNLTINKVVPVSSPRVAEMTKLLENIHRSVNIGLANEMKMVADKMGIDIFEVVDAAATKPFGFTPFYPGPGIGGHCIPIDPFYLTWKAREYGLHTRFIELAGEINKAMPDFVVSKLTLALNTQGKSVKGSRILILGVAYKRDVDDVRESPSLQLIDVLQGLGALISYSDPFIPVLPKTRAFDFDMTSVNLSTEELKKYDALILVTDHSQFDYDIILENANLIIDTRGKFRKSSPNIVRA